MRRTAVITGQLKRYGRGLQISQHRELTHDEVTAELIEAAQAGQSGAGPGLPSSFLLALLGRHRQSGWQAAEPGSRPRHASDSSSG